MIPVLESRDGTLERVIGNPTLTSRDCERRAPLATILHESWSAEDRAAFGVHLVEVPKVPRGKRQVGPAVLEKVAGAAVGGCAGAGAADRRPGGRAAHRACRHAAAPGGPRGRCRGTAVNLLSGSSPGMLLAPQAAGAAVQARYVGQYAYNYGGTNGANLTIPAAHFTLAGPNKQILIAWSRDVPVMVNLLVASVRAAICASDPTGACRLWSAPFPAAPNVGIALVLSATSTEAGALHVWEVTGAAPLHEGFGMGSNAVAVLAPVLARYAPAGSITFGVASNIGDTGTVTWSGLTEDADADVGDFAQSVAHTPVPLAVEIRDAIIATGLGGGAGQTDAVRAAIVSAIPQGLAMVRGGCLIKTNTTGGFNPNLTIATAGLSDFANSGSFKLVVFVTLAVDIATTVNGMTFDGLAMTLIGSVVNTATASPHLQIFAFAIDVSEADATGPLVINFNTIPFLVPVGWTMFKLYGCGRVGAAQSAEGDGAGAAVAVNVSQGGVILASHIRNTSNAQAITWTGAEEIEDIDNGGYVRSFGARWNCAAQIARSVQAAGAEVSPYATLAIPFNP